MPETANRPPQAARERHGPSGILVAGGALVFVAPLCLLWWEIGLSSLR